MIQPIDYYPESANRPAVRRKVFRSRSKPEAPRRGAEFVRSDDLREEAWVVYVLISVRNQYHMDQDVLISLLWAFEIPGNSGASELMNFGLRGIRHLRVGARGLVHGTMAQAMGEEPTGPEEPLTSLKQRRLGRPDKN